MVSLFAFLLSSVLHFFSGIQNPFYKKKGIPVGDRAKRGKEGKVEEE